jgi:hypothetical protein
MTSCTDDFTELNTDPKNFTLAAVTQSEYPLFVKRALYTPNYLPFGEARGPFQLGHSLFPDIYANYFATTAPNFDSDQFILVGGWLNGAYNWFYSRAAPNIQIAEETAAELGFTTEEAIMKIWKVYAYHRITDLWGPIPYSQFGNGENSVPFDSQEAIYNDFFATLDEAIGTLQNSDGTFLGGDDVLYGGDLSKWIKFGNTLRLRLAMRVRFVDPALGKSNAEKAVAGGVMMGNEDNAVFVTDINFRNMYNTITQWGEFRMSADMESILKGYHDPRVDTYFAPAAQPDPSDNPSGIEFPYEGIRNGQLKADKQSAELNFNETASDMAAAFTLGGDPGPNWVVMASAEAYFLRAEGALVGWNMQGSAEDLYDQGIAMSHEQHGYDGNTLGGMDYINSMLTPASYDGTTPPVSTVPVDYNAGGSQDEQLEQIITQKWIALYPDSEEAYAERRRTGYPTLYNRLNSLNADIPVDKIPKRMTYVATEYDNNTAAVEEAVNNLLGGPDTGATPLWWDVGN